MKYLHLYKTKEEFEPDYYGGDIVESFDCELGRFTFDRVDSTLFPMPVYYWTNNERELVTDTRNLLVGSYAFDPDSDGDGIPFEEPDDLIAYEITAVQTSEDGKYIEPWVSYTKDFGYVGQLGETYDYIGDMQEGIPT